MKELRIKVLERVIKHMIQGNQDRAERLIESLLTAMGTAMVNEANYGNAEDPMFPARRELQRELEQDIEQDTVDASTLDDTGATPAEPAFPEDQGEEECTAEQIGQLIASLVAGGQVDDEKLGAIIDILTSDAGGMEEPALEPELEPTGEVPPPEDPESIDAGPGEFPAPGNAPVDDPNSSSFKM